MVAYEVWLNAKRINIVYYLPGMTAQEVRRSLIDHDNMNPNIVVLKKGT